MQGDSGARIAGRLCGADGVSELRDQIWSLSPMNLPVPQYRAFCMLIGRNQFLMLFTIMLQGAKTADVSARDARGAWPQSPLALEPARAGVTLRAEGL